MSVRYKIYPSLLNCYQTLLDADILFEADSNVDGEGNYKRTIEEIEKELIDNLLATINREKAEPIEAAEKGTAFNEIIDRIITHSKDGNPAILIKSHKEYTSPNGLVNLPCENITADTHGFGFCFDANLCRGVAKDLSGAAPQYRCSAILPTMYGDVELYGFVDYILRDKVIDLKTTKRYTFLKFEHNWQKEVYPYCLIESGDMEDVTEFEFYVVSWKDLVDKPTQGTIYKENYTYRHDTAKGKLINICESFIEWLESHKEQITNKKIFGLE